MLKLNKIYNMDCREGLKKIAAGTVDTCITSPPYYGLRDYGHPAQLGMEPTPKQYVDNIVDICNGIYRALKPSGTLWINIGDSYASSAKNKTIVHQTKGSGLQGGKANQVASRKQPNKITGNLKPKDLIGIPWMVAFALRDAGWYLRQEIIWHKPNAMPESVNDRCTKAHEQLFLLSKNENYYWDKAAMIVPATSSRSQLKSHHNPANAKYDAAPSERWKDQFNGRQWGEEGTANRRSVWTIPTKPFTEAHFATFPEELIIPCVLATSHIGGGIILDPFMGAGTTALVAKKLQRSYIGFEINKQYITIANKRLKL